LSSPVDWPACGIVGSVCNIGVAVFYVGCVTATHPAANTVVSKTTAITKATLSFIFTAISR